MDFKTAYPRFFLCHFEPAEAMCCKALPLKSAVVIVSVLDIVVALLSCAELIMTIWTSAHDSTHSLLLTCFADLLALTAAPVALLALCSLHSGKYTHIRLYSLYKQVEVLVLAVFTAFEFRVNCVEGDQGCDLISMTAIWTCKCVFNLYFAFLVWSAAVRLGNNETLLVIFGRDMIKIMQEQAMAASPRGSLPE